jgi:hypothetical protein|tara:strand:+ start:5217 stop:5483 length:267 start_codon:yes stop_codon:yes gene_type:complete
MELTVEELVYFASLKNHQCEKVRRDRYENYDFLVYIEKQIDDQIIDPQSKLKELDDLKQIRHLVPTPNDACQELKLLNGEDCEECQGV